MSFFIHRPIKLKIGTKLRFSLEQLLTVLEIWEVLHTLCKNGYKIAFLSGRGSTDSVLKNWKVFNPFLDTLCKNPFLHICVKMGTKLHFSLEGVPTLY